MMPKIDLEVLREELYSRIDIEDTLEVKKVNDLIRLHELDSLCDEAIDRDGVSIIVENGSQQFIKSHPSMNEKMKINSQKIALEKSIKFKPVGTDSLISSDAESDKDKRDDLI